MATSANMPVSQYIATLGGRLPVANANQRMVGPTWINLAVQVANNTANQEISLTTAAAFNQSRAARSVFSSTTSVPEARLHMEGFQVYLTDENIQQSSNANINDFLAGSYLKAVIGGTQYQFDCLRATFDPRTAYATTVAATTLGRTITNGPSVLSSPIRIDLQDDEFSFCLDPAINFGAAANIIVCVYGWLYPRNMVDADFSEGACPTGSVTPARFRQLNTSFQAQLGMQLLK